MKIGLIAPPWIPVPPPAYGGTEAVVDNLARSLSARGHEVTLFSVGTSTCPVDRHHLFDEPVARLGDGAAEAAHVLAAYESLRTVDLIHDHTVLGALLAGRSGMPGPPVVVTNHGPFTPVTRRLYVEIARTAAVVAISTDQARRAGDEVPIAAIIHHGVDLDVYRPGPPPGEHLVFIGRMSPDKGVDRGRRVAPGTPPPRRGGTKMREAEEVDYYESCIRALLPDEAVPPEELALHEKIAVLQTAAALLNPIAWPEPFGLVMAESLATGTPVVASPVGSAPEIVLHRHTGFLCETDIDAVQCVGVIESIDRGACRADAENRFSAERMAFDYERLYRRLLEPSGQFRRQLVEPSAGPEQSLVSSGAAG